MVELMIGRKLEDFYVSGSYSGQKGGFKLEGIRTQANPKHAIDLEIRRGEILGMAGLVGAGRTELARALFGIEPALGGSIAFDGQALPIRSSRDAIRNGVFLVPEDRRAMGLITEMNLRENITLPSMKEHSHLSLIDRALERKTARGGIESLQVKTPSAEVAAANLSGGNQQKVVLAKWLARDPRLLIVDEPTRGIDVGAKAEIYRLMRELADRGVAILMISSDMEEVLGVSDRIAVMHEGRLMGVLEREQFSEKAVMRWAVGKAQEN
jgi:ribose transport system ATP-binding protein